MMDDIKDIARKIASELSVEAGFYFTDELKPMCVLGVLDTQVGHNIEVEMLEWLMKSYNVIGICHDGKDYEYPPIKFIQRLEEETDIPYVLYLHTKGAANQNRWQKIIRDMWKEQFTENMGAYLSVIKTTAPVVACPYSSKEGNTWFNGFFCNREAWLSHPKIEKHPNNRYYFESMFAECEGITVKGVLSDGITAEGVMKIMEKIFQKNKSRISTVPKIWF